MENNNNINNRAGSGELEEIDLIEIAVRLWSKRKFILKVTAGFMVLGFLIGVFSTNMYTSECIMVPQTSSTSSSSSLGSLAQLAGISLNTNSSEVISPEVYSNVLQNINLQKELISTSFYFNKYDKDITLFDYYTADEYYKFSVMDTPRIIRTAIFGEHPENPYLLEGRDPQLQYYTKEEAEAVSELSKSIELTIEDDGYIIISATMPEAILSAQVVNRVKELLQKYITEFKIEKAKSEYEFVQKLYDEAKVDFEVVQLKYATFRDANKILTSASSQIRETTLKAEYDIANATLNELTSQLIQTEIKLKENTPSFIIIEPTKVPRRKSAPNSNLILIAFTLLGGVLACGLVLLFDALKSAENVEIKSLEKWQ